jgi:hypothetical protein
VKHAATGSNTTIPKQETNARVSIPHAAHAKTAIQDSHRTSYDSDAMPAAPSTDVRFRVDYVEPQDGAR